MNTVKKILFFTFALLIIHWFLFYPSWGIFNQYTEKRPDNFVLSVEKPISTGHGFIGTSTDTTPVDMLSYEVHFRIPRNYIDRTLLNIKDKTLDFSLVTLFPDFIGVNVERKSARLTEEDKIWINSPNLIHIATSHQDFDPEHDANTIVFKAEENEPDHPWKYGLLQSLKKSSNLANIYFQRPIQNNSGYMVSCVNGENEFCAVDVRITPNLKMMYLMPNKLLPHWQEVDHGVKQLINSFIIKDKPALNFVIEPL